MITDKNKLFLLQYGHKDVAEKIAHEDSDEVKNSSKRITKDISIRKNNDL